MKKLLITSILALLTTVVSTAGRQDWPDEYLGLPGDNLNLYAVMNLFQQSETIEGFERNLNDESSRVNNLDLNGDNRVDYIMVTDYMQGNVHTIVMRVALDRNEMQDVAVFTVEKFRDGSVQMQLVGDEALYGKNYIIEPIYDDQYAETPNPGYTGVSGNTQRVIPVRTTTVHISAWPLIRYIFLPDYIAWRSRWYWGYWPSNWYAWQPYYWHYYYGYHSNWYPHYYSHYRHWDHYRFPNHHQHYYSSIRTFSPQVNIWINRGRYKNTYSRPELRKDGEALYSRTNSGQKAERQRLTGTNSRSGNNPARAITSASNDRRNSSTVSTRQNSRTSASGNSAVTRRSSSPAEGGNTRSSATLNSNATARSSASVNTKSATRSSSGKEGITQRRATSPSSARVATQPSAGATKSATRSGSVTTGRSSQVSAGRTGSIAANRSSQVATGRSTTSRPSSVQSSASRERTASPAVKSGSSSRSATMKSASTSQRSSSVTTGRSASRPSAVQSSPSVGRSSSGGSSARMSTKSASMPRSSGHSAPSARGGSRSGSSDSGRSGRR